MKLLFLVLGVLILAFSGAAIWLLTQVSMFRKGFEFEEKGDVEEAKRCYSEAIRENPNDVDSKYRLFLIHEKNENHDEALILAESIAIQSTIEGKKLIGVMTFLLNCYKSGIDFEKIYIASRKLCFLGAKNFTAYLFLAKVFGGQGLREDFEDFIQEALKIDPTHSEANYLYSLYFFSSGFRQEAQEILEHIKGTDDELRKAYMALACNCHMEEPLVAAMWLSAVDDMTESLELKIPVLILLAICKMRLGEPQDARRYLDNVEFSNFPMDDRMILIFFFARAWSFHLCDERDKAREYFKKLISRNFSFADVMEHYNMGSDNGYKVVKEHFLRLYSSFPKPNFANELSMYENVKINTLDDSIKEWKSKFAKEPSVVWVMRSRDFKSMSRSEFLDAARRLPEKFQVKAIEEYSLSNSFSVRGLIVKDNIKEKILFEVQPWATQVSDFVIAETALRMEENGLNKCLIVAPGSFSRKAHEEAAVRNIRLVDGEELDGILR